MGFNQCGPACASIGERFIGAMLVAVNLDDRGGKPLGSRSLTMIGPAIGTCRLKMGSLKGQRMSSKGAPQFAFLRLRSWLMRIAFRVLKRVTSGTGM